MATVLDISMSLDGYVAGPRDERGRGLGDGGAPIHNWVMGRDWRYGDEPFAATGVDARLLASALSSAGAAIVGRRMYDIVDGWGADPPWNLPVIVVTHREQPEERRGGTQFTFVTEGIRAAHDFAVASAAGKNVHVGGGASIAQQFLAAGLIDELQVHIAPYLLGAGRRLFGNLPSPIRLDPISTQQTRHATHVRYRVLSGDNPTILEPESDVS